MITINNEARSTGNEAQAFGSFAVALADDESAKLLLPVDYGHVLVSESSANTHGMAWVRGSSTAKYFGGTNFDVLVNTVLNGTTGTDGKLTISTNANNFYIENRTGVAVSIALTFLGLSINRI